MKTGSSASKLGRSSRAKADSTCSHSVLSALMLLLLPSFAAEEPVFTVYLRSPLGQTARRLIDGAATRGLPFRKSSPIRVMGKNIRKGISSSTGFWLGCLLDLMRYPRKELDPMQHLKPLCY